MKNEFLLHFTIFCVLIFAKTDETKTEGTSEIFNVFKDQLKQHVEKLKYKIKGFLSHGNFGDVFIVEKSAEKNEAAENEEEDKTSKEFALKIVKNFESFGIKICDKYKLLNKLLLADSEHLLLPLEIEAREVDSTKIQDDFYKKINSFCFLLMNLGIQNFNSPISNLSGLENIDKEIAQKAFEYFFAQILNGIKSMLKNGVFHNDLSAKNIVIFAKKTKQPNSEVYENYEAKLIDFDIINMHEMRSLKSQDDIKDFLERATNAVTFVLYQILTINQEVLLSDVKEFPFWYIKVIVDEHFPYFSKFFVSIEEHIKQAFKEFLKNKKPVLI